MATKANFRVRVMKYAWRIRKATGNTISACLMKAWAIYRMGKRMKGEAVTFFYRKADGTLRKAVGTLLASTPKAWKAAEPAYKTFTYFDIEKGDYRCFKVENLVGVV